MNDIHALSFEQAYAALQEVVEKLESGDLPLEEAMTLYERGKALSARCQQLLTTAELRVQQLNET